MNLDPDFMAHHYSTLNISETEQERDMVTMEYELTHALTTGVSK